MRRLTTAGGHVDIEVVRALDGWLAQQWEFGRRGHAGAEQGGLGEDGPDRWAPSVSNGGTVTGWQAGVKMGRGRCRGGPTA
jgi:hypothetical protein